MDIFRRSRGSVSRLHIIPIYPRLPKKESLNEKEKNKNKKQTQINMCVKFTDHAVFLYKLQVLQIKFRKATPKARSSI